MSDAAKPTSDSADESTTENGSSGEPLLEVDDLKTHFPIRNGLFRREIGKVYAVDGVSFSVQRGETLGIVGESGCGKTTLGRSILRLIEPTAGGIWFNGEDIVAAAPGRMRELRADMQIVFQDPYASLNPRHPINEIVAEPLLIHGHKRADALERVGELMKAVGLLPEYGNRYPHEFSGGQRQRIGIARALALQPQMIVLDEPVSALDVSVQAQVINLLEELQDAHDLTYLFIAHDLAVVHHMADRVAVLYLGKIVEIADRDTLYGRPTHPYTHSLLSAVPVADPDLERSRKRIVLGGELPNPARPPTGCNFRTRCPIATSRCATEEPDLREVAPGQLTACHYAVEAGANLVELVSPAPSTSSVLSTSSVSSTSSTARQEDRRRDQAANGVSGQPTV